MKRIKIYKIFKNKVPQEYRLEDHKHMWNLVSLDEITIKLDNINIKDKSFYRYEKLSLPRVKVDKLKEDHNISITRNKNNADFRVVSIQSLEQNNNFSSYHNRFYRVGELKKQINLQLPNQHLDALSILEKLDDNDYVYFYHYSTMPNLDIDPETIPPDGVIINDDTWNEISAKDNLILDQDLVTLCNSNAPIIDKEQYFNMVKMIQSKDDQNIILVNEILANCNIQKSFEYVALIYYFYHNNLRYSSNWNNINVKSLRVRMKAFDSGRSDSKSRGWYYKFFLQQLNKENKVTKFAFKVVQRYIHNNVIERILDNHNKDAHYNTDDISITIDPDAIKLPENFIFA
tara:strand:+ start:772 stop:1806 length:1035 start_codon:yes stop_codon:yes gene_type:complete